MHVMGLGGLHQIHCDCEICASFCESSTDELFTII